jgi:E3 ubiquitin-protein ligase DOA10
MESGVLDRNNYPGLIETNKIYFKVDGLVKSRFCSLETLGPQMIKYRSQKTFYELVKVISLRKFRWISEKTYGNR